MANLGERVGRKKANPGSDPAFQPVTGVTQVSSPALLVEDEMWRSQGPLQKMVTTHKKKRPHYPKRREKRALASIHEYRSAHHIFGSSLPSSIYPIHPSTHLSLELFWGKVSASQVYHILKRRSVQSAAREDSGPSPPKSYRRGKERGNLLVCQSGARTTRSKNNARK